MDYAKLNESIEYKIVSTTLTEDQNKQITKAYKEHILGKENSEKFYEHGIISHPKDDTKSFYTEIRKIFNFNKNELAYLIDGYDAAQFLVKVTYSGHKQMPSNIK